MRDALLFLAQVALAVIFGSGIGLALIVECQLIEPGALLVAAIVVSVAGGFSAFGAIVDRMDRAVLRRQRAGRLLP